MIVTGSGVSMASSSGRSRHRPAQWEAGYSAFRERIKGGLEVVRSFRLPSGYAQVYISCGSLRFYLQEKPRDGHLRLRTCQRSPLAGATTTPHGERLPERRGL